MSPISCNSGFKSLPSIGGNGNVRSKGFDVSKINRPKPTAIMPSTDNTLATNTKGSVLLNTATAALHNAKTKDHKSKEPSCADQTALTLYWVGNSEFEC